MTAADYMNLGIYLLWKKYPTRIRLLAQLHDAVYFLFREDDNEAELIAEVQALLEIPIKVNGRMMSIPSEAKTGWNFANYDNSTNPDGLKKWKGKDERTRAEYPAESILAWKFS